jgi:hypothetical protein
MMMVMTVSTFFVRALGLVPVYRTDSYTLENPETHREKSGESY